MLSPKRNIICVGSISDTSLNTILTKPRAIGRYWSIGFTDALMNTKTWKYHFCCFSISTCLFFLCASEVLFEHVRRCFNIFFLITFQLPLHIQSPSESIPSNQPHTLSQIRGGEPIHLRCSKFRSSFPIFKILTSVTPPRSITGLSRAWAASRLWAPITPRTVILKQSINNLGFFYKTILIQAPLQNPTKLFHSKHICNQVCAQYAQYTSARPNVMHASIAAHAT